MHGICVIRLVAQIFAGPRAPDCSFIARIAAVSPPDELPTLISPTDILNQALMAFRIYCRYGEVCDDNFEFKNPDNEKARGFTQLVWKDTSRIGVGKATGRGKNGEICIYIVGVYRPPGNLVGFFGENVEKGTFDKDEYCKLGEDEYDEKENEGSSANDSSHEKEKPDEEEEEEEEEEKGEEENNEDQNVAVAVKDKTEKVHKNANKKNLKNANKKNKS